MAAVPLPAAFNSGFSTLLIGANVPGQPSGVLFSLPVPFPLPFVAQPAGAQLII
jgi:hypothetical protein